MVDPAAQLSKKDMQIQTKGFFLLHDYLRILQGTGPPTLPWEQDLATHCKGPGMVQGVPDRRAGLRLEA